MVTDTLSLDRFKRRSGFPSLRAYFEAAYGGADSPTFAAAQRNFACSLAAYSMVCYILAIKDRHNGNILLDRHGHLVHIDFGFVLGRAPGGVASLEASVPFKLTREMVDVLGGPRAPLFTETFVELCTAALRSVREHADTLLSINHVATTLDRMGDRAAALPLSVVETEVTGPVATFLEGLGYASDAKQEFVRRRLGSLGRTRGRTTRAAFVPSCYLASARAALAAPARCLALWWQVWGVTPRTQLQVLVVGSSSSIFPNSRVA